MKNNRLLNLKYALVNAFYFMLVCGTAGYANNFLQYKGFAKGEVGAVLTIISIIALVLQTGMAPVIDRSSKLTEKKFILFTLVIGAVMYALLLVLPAGSNLLLVATIVGFAFASAGMPFLNSLAFAYEQEGGKINYGIGRGVGSCAYAVGGAVIGWLIALEGGGDEKIVSVLPMYLLVTCVLTILMVAWMKEPKKVVQEEKKDIETEEKQLSYGAFFKKYKSILIVLLALVLIFFAHMLINTYMIDVLQSIGGNTTDQGNAIFVQAMVELPTTFLFALILKKFDVDKLMVFGSIMYIVKHALICFAPSVPIFYLAMVMQMFSYAVVVPGTVYFAAKHVEDKDRNKGQAIMSASMTVGGLFASLIGGVVLSTMSVHGVMLVVLWATILGAGIMFIGIRILDRKPEHAD